VQTDVAILIVGFRNSDAIANCLQALKRATGLPRFEIFVSENGGAAAMDRLVTTICGPSGPCRPSSDPMSDIVSVGAPRQRSFDLISEEGWSRARVHVAESPANLGYAGGVNAWLRPLLLLPGWSAAWILNPDTEPSPTALAELADYSSRRRKGMVAGCLMQTASSNEIQLRGLAWSKLGGRSIAIDQHAPREFIPSNDDLESRLGAPSGACIYIRRDLIEAIGLMDDSYFLYYEDLEWGYRARARNEIGYAHRAIVPHKGGSTIRSSGGRASTSPLAVYLEFRNRILFVRKHLPHWAAWTIFMQALHIAVYAFVGAHDNTIAAFRGLAAGLRGETGRPKRYMSEHLLLGSDGVEDRSRQLQET
jgi:N-acetylglucosaminyl-diphospho-decaprenol L-rhamnosyltransferase